MKQLNNGSRWMLTGLTAVLLAAGCTTQGHAPSVADGVAAQQASQQEVEKILEKRKLKIGESLQTIPGFYISGWSPVNDRHIQVDSGPGREYLLTFSSPCRDLQFANRIALTKTAGSLTVLDKVIVHVGYPQHCLVQTIHKLERVRQDAERQ